MNDPLTVRNDVTPDDLRTPCGKVYDMLERYFWTNGGWLSAVGEGQDRIIVMTTRRLRPDEARLIPKEQDGVPVVVRVTGKFLPI